MAHTFRVDDVPPRVGALEERTLGDFHDGALYSEPGADQRCVVLPGMPVLVGAVHLAFAGHHPLVLSPDIVWLTIAQGFALHVAQHGEALRSRLVRHAGKRTLELKWGGPVPGADRDAWHSIVAGFRDLLANAIGEGRARLLECEFSTTTDTEKTASRIVLLDAYSRYFDYEMTCVCGIPEVTVLGTPADYELIAQKLAVLREFDLGFWVDSLEPIVAELRSASAGSPNRAFWREIYKPEKAYGAEKVTGWIGRLYPYVGVGGRYEFRNPLLAMPHDAVMKLAAERKPGGWFAGPCVEASSLPSTLSSVLIRLTDLDGSKSDLLFEAGPLFVEKDERGALVPRAGFVIRRSRTSTADLIDAIRAHHSFVPAKPEDRPRAIGFAELTALHDVFESASLMNGRIRILPSTGHQHVQFADGPMATLVAIASEWAIGLRHGKNGTVAIRFRRDALAMEGAWWERLMSTLRGAASMEPKRSSETTEQVAVIGRTLTDVLMHALAHDGALPDPIATLRDELPEWERERTVQRVER